MLRGVSEDSTYSWPEKKLIARQVPEIIDKALRETVDYRYMPLVSFWLTYILLTTAPFCSYEQLRYTQRWESQMDTRIP